MARHAAAESLRAREDPDVMYSRGAWLFASATLCVGNAAQATAFYDNTGNPTGSNAVLSGNTWADDLHMTSGGSVRLVEFGYVAAGATQATICFYDNDATNSIYPGDGAQLLFLDTVVLDPQSSGLASLVVDPALVLPQHVWFTIKFNSFSGAVPLYDPPLAGSSADVLVRADGSLWNGSAPQSYFREANNFEVRIGTEIPTPGSLSILGGALLLGSRRRR